MRILWTAAAAYDLQQINDYLKDHHPQYRELTVRKIYSAIQSLREWPSRGRIGREQGTRELAFPPLPYIAAYRVTEQSIEILRMFARRSRTGAMSTGGCPTTPVLDS